MSRARYILTQMRTELFLVSNYGRSARNFAQGSEDLRAQGPIGPEVKQKTKSTKSTTAKQALAQMHVKLIHPTSRPHPRTGHLCIVYTSKLPLLESQYLNQNIS